MNQFGHRTGDAVLAQVGDRLPAVGREDDLLARVGGDEFAMIVVDGAPADRARVTATALIQAIAQLIVTR